MQRAKLEQLRAVVFLVALMLGLAAAVGCGGASGEPDANGDGLAITSVDTSALHGVATVTRSGNLLDTATNVLKDSGSGVVRSIQYSLAGVTFSGDETLMVTVSDGVTSTTVPVTIHVDPAPAHANTVGGAAPSAWVSTSARPSPVRSIAHSRS